MLSISENESARPELFRARAFVAAVQRCRDDLDSDTAARA